ncbi:MAG TPA: histidine triad nucleotide-binding protein [Lentisphaeria bacterium]|jgi:histidine triad (HIT) family protein|nr:histidine triad nucleotide-binding protein [Lentisphaeria bacterium]
MADCLFCKMVSGEINPDTVYEDDDILAFKDINPQAPLHVLIIPKAHIATVNDLSDANAATVGRLFLTAKQIAADNDLTDPGYRLVVNCNADAGQTVFHIHLHLLGGRPMTWPPG